MSSSFYFVRHAETPWNLQNLCQGQKDVELSSNGREEAARFASLLPPLPFSCIVTSPLKRAYETAQLIHDHNPELPFFQVEELQERGWGQLEGQSSEEMYAIEKREEKDPFFYPGMNVESRSAFLSRIHVGLERALRLGSSPLIVSHGRVFLGLCEMLHLPLVRQVPHLVLVEFRKIDQAWVQRTL